MLEDAVGIRRVVLACGTVDLRKGIDGLATIIGDKYGQNPFEKGTLFLFCGKVILAKEYAGSSGAYRRTVQVPHDGFESPGSQNQRCRSEKYLLETMEENQNEIPNVEGTGYGILEGKGTSQ